MNDPDKTKEELRQELQDLLQKYNSLKLDYDKDIAELKQSKLALQESEERYRLINDASLDQIYSYDLENRFTSANKALCANLRLSTEEVIGKSYWEFGFPEAQCREWDELHRQVYAFGSKMATVSKPMPDGTIHYFETNLSLIHDGAGKVIGIAGVNRNITERKRAEEKQKESEKKFRNLVWDLPVGVLLQGPQAEMLLSNPAALELLGLTEDQLMGKSSFDPYWNVIHEDGSPFPGQTHPVPTAIAKGLPVRNVVMGVDRPEKKDRVWLLVSAIPQLDEKGKVQQVVCIFINITKRKHAEEVLKSSEIRYRRLFESAKDGILILDADTGMIVDVNPFLVTLLGYSHDVFLEKRIWEIGLFKDIFANQDNFLELQQKGYIRYEDLPLKTSDGRTIQVEFLSNMYLVNQHKVIQCNIRDITERKRAEEERDRIFNLVPGLVCIASTDGYFKELNPEWENVLGFSKEELLSKPFTSFIHPDDIESTFKEVEKQIGGKSTIDFVNRYICKDGHYKWLDWVASPSVDGKLLYAAARDITEHKLAEKALYESNMKFSTLFEKSPNAITLSGIPNGIFKNVNEAFEKIFGYTKHEAIGKTSQELGLNPDKKGREIIIKELEEQGSVHNQELALKTKYGELRYFSVSMDLMEIAGQKFILNTSIDITKRKHAQEELKESEEKFRTLFQNHTAVKLLIDPDNGNIVDANIAAAEFYGWPVEKLKTMQISEINILSPDEIKKEMNSAKNKIKSHFEFKHRKADGTIWDVAIQSGNIPINGKEYLYSIVQNITERKKLENERKLSQEKLREFAAMLQQSREEERKRIAREIHDEFGQVLTAIKMNLTMLGNEVSQADKPIVKVAILDEISNMKSIIDHTIHNVRVFTNKLRPDVLDTFGLVEALDAHIGEFAKLYNIKCTFEKSEEEIAVEMNKSIAVYRIVQEALTNVARHAQATEVDISISKHDNFLNVSIEDNGKGIERTRLDHAKSFGIIGMKERAQICRGTLLLTSEQGKGTKIFLSMPIKEND